MDLTAKRVKARNLEVEGKLREALDVYRDILAHEPTSEQLLPIAIQASELSLTLGNRETGVTMLLAAADRYAESGLGWQVIDLHQRIRRLDPSRKGLDLRLARRMLERRHPQAAREFLADLARRFKKEKLRQMLAKMEGWSDDEVQRRLLAFLDRAEGIRGSTTVVRPAEPVVAAPTPPPPTPPAPAPPPTRAADPPPATPKERPATAAPEPPGRPTSTPPELTGAPVDRATGPRMAPRIPAPAPEPAAAPAAPPAAPPPKPVPERPRLPSEPVVFVSPAVSEAAPEPAPVPETPARRFRDRRSRPSRIPSVVVAAVVIVAAGGGGLFLGMRLGDENGLFGAPADSVARSTDAGPELTIPPVNDPLPSASVPVESLPAVAQTGGAVPAVGGGGSPTAQAPVVAAAAPPAAPSRQPEPSVPVQTARPAVMTASASTAMATVQPRSAPASAPPPTVVRQQTPPPTPAAPQSAQPAPPAVSLGADYPFVMVEGLEVTDIAEEVAGATRRVVVKQLLPSGDTLELRASNLGASSVGLGGGRLLVSRHPSGGAMGTVRVGQHLVSARALVTPEVLEPFLRRLVEVVPE